MAQKKNGKMVTTMYRDSRYRDSKGSVPRRGRLNLTTAPFKIAKKK